MGTGSNILPSGVVNMLKIGCREKIENPFFKWVSNTKINTLLVYTTMKPLFHFTMFVKVENLNMCWNCSLNISQVWKVDYNHID